MAAALATAIVAVGPELARAQGEADGDETARMFFEEGRVAFESGRYEVAFESWREAYERSGRPQLLYNLGLAADRLRRDDEALGYYKRYLHELPDAPNRWEAENRIRALERARREPAMVTHVTAPSQPDVNHPRADGDLWEQWWFWTAAGVVVTGVVVSVAIATNADAVRDPRPGSAGVVVVALDGP